MFSTISLASPSFEHSQNGFKNRISICTFISFFILHDFIVMASVCVCVRADYFNCSDDFSALLNDPTNYVFGKQNLLFSSFRSLLLSFSSNHNLHLFQWLPFIFVVILSSRLTNPLFAGVHHQNDFSFFHKIQTMSQ